MVWFNRQYSKVLPAYKTEVDKYGKWLQVKSLPGNMDRRAVQLKTYLMRKIKRRLTLVNFNQLKDSTFQMDCDVDYAQALQDFVTKCGGDWEYLSLDSALLLQLQSSFCACVAPVSFRSVLTFAQLLEQIPVRFLLRPFGVNRKEYGFLLK